MSNSLGVIEKWKSITWLGDQSVPWFDDQWPLNRGVKQWFTGLDEVDLEKTSPVVGFAGTTEGIIFPSGRTSEDFDDRLVQKVLVKRGEDWCIIKNHAKSADILARLPGLSGLISQDEDGDVLFHGDSLMKKDTPTLEIVADVLEDWGISRSEHAQVLRDDPNLQQVFSILDGRGIFFSGNATQSRSASAETGRGTAKPQKIAKVIQSRSLADLPPLNETNGEWILPGSPKMIALGWGNSRSLDTKRSPARKDRIALKNEDGTAGVDDSDFGWRKDDDGNYWYFLPWLTKNKRQPRKGKR